ncbi:single-stranded DNA-binding protein [Arthrobacter sp. MP_2.3]|uniref:single-stranded DNA-binding protein n=1 Tax=Arthrobacter sp. MP_2.3 TaxID=3349633 RepID=UPI0038D4BE4F
MSDNITVRGFVVTEITSSTTPGGVATASFRIGSTTRRYDRAANAWVDVNTNWFTVQGYRQLAGNLGCSIKKGQRVIVVGKLKMRSWENAGRIYHRAEIDAEAVGHDLMFGSANYIRTATHGPQSAAGPSPFVTEGADQERTEHDQDHHGDEYDQHQEGNQEDGPAAPSVFVDDVTGEESELDEQTGELKGAAA